MVGGFDFESHFLKGQANVSAALFTEVDGALVEISAGVVGFCGGAALLVKLEKEEFALGSHVEFITHVVGLFDDLFEYVAGITGKGLHVGAVDVAYKTGGLALLKSPGENHKGVDVGNEVHIRFLNTRKTLDGGAVEHTLVVKGFFKLT